VPDRKTYLGSGDIAAVAGVSPYSSALDVWARKTGAVPEVEQTERMRVGIVLEQPIIRELYAEPRGFIVETPGHVAHPEFPHFGATVDALAGKRTSASQLADPVIDDPLIVECKVVGPHMQKRWGTVDEDGPDAVPPDVLVQVQWQMFCTGLTHADVVALLGTEVRVYRVEYDPSMAANLETIGASFWDLVQRKEAPLITAEHASNAKDLIARLYPRQTLDLAEATVAEGVLIEGYIAARDAVKVAEQQKDECAAFLTAAIGEREGLLGEGIKATWKAGAKGNTAWKALALDLGASDDEIASHTGTPTRRLDVRRVKSRR
jgi:putative phage-type endonuclease